MGKTPKFKAFKGSVQVSRCTEEDFYRRNGRHSQGYKPAGTSESNKKYEDMLKKSHEEYKAKKK